ncbi:MAG: imidazoleglycerol-phosphate dehydratase [Candidatus Omnitrophota bacterium]
MPKSKPARNAKIKRKTTETEIDCSLNIDGKGKAEVSTGIGLLDHMLELFTFHGLFDLKLKVKGDLGVDMHHTNEDAGIVLGQALKKALGNMRGIVRFGSASVPMEEVLADVALDIGGRGHFGSIKINFEGVYVPVEEAESYSLKYANHFFESFAKQSGINLIIKIESTFSSDTPIDIHTCLEPVFKAWALALKRAASIDPRRTGVPSTKGIID